MATLSITTENGGQFKITSSVAIKFINSLYIFIFRMVSGEKL
jgi:hypothetical protein